MLSPAYALIHSGGNVGKTIAGGALGGLGGAMLASSMSKKKPPVDPNAPTTPPMASFGG